MEVSAWTKASSFAPRAQSAASTLRRINRLAPLVLDAHHLRPSALSHVGHPSAEDPVDRHDGHISGLKDVHDARFHGAGPRTWQRQANMLRSVKQPRQADLDVFHQILKRRIQMADRWTRLGQKNPGRDVGGAGAHENTGGRVETFHRRDIQTRVFMA